VASFADEGGEGKGFESGLQQQKTCFWVAQRFAAIRCWQEGGFSRWGTYGSST